MLIFCSYTLKDGLLTIDKLKEIKSELSVIAQTYIDILDNDSANKQERVVRELKKSNMLLVLMTPNIKESAWVETEYRIAEEYNIPILEVDANHIDKIKDLLIERSII